MSQGVGAGMCGVRSGEVRGIGSCCGCLMPDAHTASCAVRGAGAGRLLHPSLRRVCIFYFCCRPPMTSVACRLTLSFSQYTCDDQPMALVMVLSDSSAEKPSCCNRSTHATHSCCCSGVSWLAISALGIAAAGAATAGSAERTATRLAMLQELGAGRDDRHLAAPLAAEHVLLRLVRQCCILEC
jgi:hypothetical protein